MAKKNSLLNVFEMEGTTHQNLYVDSGAAYKICDELRARGTRRILILSSSTILKRADIINLIEFYKEEKFRIFIYQRKHIYANSADINDGFSMYREFNCDTVIGIGGRHDIDVAKMIQVLDHNPGTPESFSGIGNVKVKIRPLVAIMTDCTVAISSPDSDFMSRDTGKWHTVLSNLIVPHMAVIDSDLMLRNNGEDIAKSALTALSIAIEAHISPFAVNNPAYSANSLIAITKIVKNLDKLVANPTDSYLHRMVGTGGFYAGLSAQKTGFGYSYIIKHKLMEHYDVEYGAGIGQILPQILYSSLETSMGPLSDFARKAEICTSGLDERNAALCAIETIESIYRKHTPKQKLPLITPDDAEKIAQEVNKDIQLFGLDRYIETGNLVRIIFSLSGGN